MSDRYSWSSMDGGTIFCGISSGSEYLLERQIAERMNLMQHVVDAAKECQKLNGNPFAPDSARGRLDAALKALTPPKTVEQLRDERDAAADALANYSCRVYLKDQNLYLDRYKEARAAHLAAVKGGL